MKMNWTWRNKNLSKKGPRHDTGFPGLELRASKHLRRRRKGGNTHGWNWNMEDWMSKNLWPLGDLLKICWVRHRGLVRVMVSCAYGKKSFIRSSNENCKHKKIWLFVRVTWQISVWSSGLVGRSLKRDESRASWYILICFDDLRCIIFLTFLS